MLKCPEMAKKSFASMTHAERMAALARDLHSPACVDKADEILELMKHEWREIHGMRESAAIRHGESAPPPAMPIVPTSAKAEASPEAARERHPDIETVASLVFIYRTDKRSPYHQLRFRTREFYEGLIKRILKDCHDMKLADLKKQDIDHLYEGWKEGGKNAMGKALITMLRTLVYYGATILQDGDCERLSVILHRMRFSQAEPRNEHLTAELAARVRDAARAMKRASIALAQAFQIDCKLRQKDVIGEWVPLTEPGQSDVIDAEHGNKWLRGVRWEEIDENLILTHMTSKTLKEIKVDLKSADMVIEELKFAFGGVTRDQLPVSGPIIVSEVSRLPWYAVEFRRNWRLAADKSGVPKNVRNMDSRTGATSETTKSAADGDKPELEEANVDLTLELGPLSTVRH